MHVRLPRHSTNSFVKPHACNILPVVPVAVDFTLVCASHIADLYSEPCVDTTIHATPASAASPADDGFDLNLPVMRIEQILPRKPAIQEAYRADGSDGTAMTPSFYALHSCGRLAVEVLFSVTNQPQNYRLLARRRYLPLNRGFIDAQR